MSLLAPGTILQDRYRIIQPIGQGGMGAVYEAVQERLKRRVAVKQLLIVGEARRNRAFLREAQILANLEHRSLPDIIDYFTDDAGHFLVMDFVPGDDLAVQLARRGSPFPKATVMEWADQVLDVLDYLHTQRPEPIYHGDIKPHNLKPKPNGEIMVLDFGLAKGYVAEMSRVSGESSIVGYTPGFSPPEQVEGLGIDARSDLYALGATLHRLLTNTPPVDERSRWRAVVRGRRDPLRPVHELNPLLSAAESAVLVQALALEPEERPASAAALRAALRAAYADSALEPPALAARAVAAPAFADESTRRHRPMRSQR
jgi:eukaryotic-like serine/threonine-protein kinase